MPCQASELSQAHSFLQPHKSQADDTCKISCKSNQVASSVSANTSWKSKARIGSLHNMGPVLFQMWLLDNRSSGQTIRKCFGGQLWPWVHNKLLPAAQTKMTLRYFNNMNLIQILPSKKHYPHHIHSQNSFHATFYTMPPVAAPHWPCRTKRPPEPPLPPTTFHRRRIHDGFCSRWKARHPQGRFI